MAHAGLDRLHPHEDVGLGLVPGPGELLLGGAVVGQLPHDGPDGLQGPLFLLLIQGGVDPQKAGVGVVGHIGVDGVAQPPLFPQLLEQPGGAPAPQDGVEQQQGVPLLVQIGQGGEGQDQVVLLDGLLPHRDGGEVDGLPHLGQGGLGQGGQPPGEGIHVPLLKAARQGGHNGPGDIVLPLPPAQALPGHVLQGGGLSQDGAAQGAALVHRHGQPLSAQILGGVLVHADLLQDHPPLQGRVPLVKPGVKEHIAQHLPRPVQVPVQAPGVEAGALLGGVGVHLAADGVHLHGQVGGGAAAGPLEGHVLDEVGGPVLLGALMAGAGPHKKSQGGGADAGDVFR